MPAPLNPDSLTGRLRVFYAENPAEWLTYADIALKFGCTNQQARNAVSRLSIAGVLETQCVVMSARFCGAPIHPENQTGPVRGK